LTYATGGSGTWSAVGIRPDRSCWWNIRVKWIFWIKWSSGFNGTSGSSGSSGVDGNFFGSSESSLVTDLLEVLDQAV
jgi:hypothetical protein